MYSIFPKNRPVALAAAAATAAMCLWGVAALAQDPAFAPLPDEALVRAETTPTVYFMENGKRRPIESVDAFRTQGFSFGDVIAVPEGRLYQYLLGEPITDKTTVVFPSEAKSLPDLAPFPAEDIQVARQDGHVLLKFTASFWNRGYKAFELDTDGGARTSDQNFPAFQRIFRADGSVRNKPVGILFWHQIHQHFHYDQFANYVLARLDGTPGTSPVVTQKTTFCMRDDRAIILPASGSRTGRGYTGCGGLKQGVSVGWADVYASTLPDQNFDVTTLPAGIYRLSFQVDPNHRFAEGSTDNNESWTIVQLDPSVPSVKVLLASAPFATSENRFPDGTLVSATGATDVYAVANGTRRRVGTRDTIAAIGFDASKIIELLPSGLSAIPATRLIRAEGSADIFMINDRGYRRRILNPQVLASYGYTLGDVMTVSTAEFNGAYKPTSLIMRSGDNRVFDVNSRTLVGSFASLPGKGLDMAAVHLVNDTDFNAYAVSVVQRGLNVPWDIAFLPDGDMLVTERTGTLRRFGKNPATLQLPGAMHVGEGGLMGIALHPDFANNHLVYLYFTTVEDGGKRNRVARFRLEGNVLTQDKLIIDNIPSALYHDGGQIAFGSDGMLYLTTGDAETSALAQDKNSLAGKTLRLTADGAIPSDNPFGTAVWSLGHRNAQGIAWDDQGRMWETEHGPTAGVNEPGGCCRDELNRIEKGKNYGWPVIKGAESKDGYETPVRNSGASVTWAPSGIAFADGRLYFAGLAGKALYVASINSLGGIGEFTSVLNGTYGRLRAVVAGPDGALYLTTSNQDGRGTPAADDDKILRVWPELILGVR